jgi:DNA-binding transcriptional regulator GbsR (MarR family)
MAQPTDPADSLSKLLFNAQHRLAVAEAFMSSDQALRYDDIATSTGVSRSVVHKEVQVLTTIGAVQRVDIERAVYFQRTPSAFWDLCTELAARSATSGAERSLRTQR